MLARDRRRLGVRHERHAPVATRGRIHRWPVPARAPAVGIGRAVGCRVTLVGATNPIPQYLATVDRRTPALQGNAACVTGGPGPPVGCGA